MSVLPRVLPPILTAIVLAIAGVSGCAGTEDGLAGIGAKKGSPSPSGLDGNLNGPGDDTGTPTPSPTPSRSPSPSPTAQVVASSISIFPGTLTLSVPAVAGAGVPANYPTTATLSAIVTMTNGSTSSAVTWESLNPSMAAIDSTSGVLTIQASGSGAGPWTLQIKATSLDQRATGIRNVTVKAEGEVALTVE